MRFMGIPVRNYKDIELDPFLELNLLTFDCQNLAQAMVGIEKNGVEIVVNETFFNLPVGHQVAILLHEFGHFELGHLYLNQSLLNEEFVEEKEREADGYAASFGFVEELLHQYALCPNKNHMVREEALRNAQYRGNEATRNWAIKLWEEGKNESTEY